MEALKHLNQHWVSVAIIVTIAIISFQIISRLFKFLNERFKDSTLHTNIRIIGRVLKGLVIFIAILAILYVFANTQEDEQFVERNFNLIIRISVTGLITILIASITRTYFTKLIERLNTNNKDTTKYQFFRSIVEVTIYFIGFLLILLAFPGMDEYAKTLLGGAGILAVILGFAAQEALSNLIAGVIIIFSEPFKIGDMISLNENMVGMVEDISLRHTLLRDFDNKMVVIPNSVMNKEKFFNYSMGDTRACQRLAFNIDFKSDVSLARKIMEEEVAKHPLSIDPRSQYQIDNGDPRVVSRVINITDNAVVIRVWAWAINYSESYNLKCDLLDSIKRRFDAEGIVIPYPHTKLVLSEHELKELSQS